MKTGKFRRVNMAISLSTKRGLYLIDGNYKGVNVSCVTNDSEAYDNMDSLDMKKRMEALGHCYFKIVETYERERKNAI